MKKFVVLKGYKKDDKIIEWLFQLLNSYSNEEKVWIIYLLFKAQFLFFISGSHKAPFGGFKKYPICIDKSAYTD